MTKGHDGLDDGARKDRIACESFIKGLRQEIKETLWEKCPNTFQEAVQAAERREVFLNSVGNRSRVNEVSEDMIGLIQKFNEDRVKSSQETWKAIQGLTTAVQALAVTKIRSPTNSPYPHQCQCRTQITDEPPSRAFTAINLDMCEEIALKDNIKPVPQQVNFSSRPRPLPDARRRWRGERKS